MIGCITQAAIDAQNAEIVKAAGREARTPAHAAAEGAVSAANSRPDSEDPGHHDAGEDDDGEAEKAYRAYLRDGRCADSPSNEPGRTRVSGEGEIAEAHHLSDGPHSVPGLDAQPPRVRLPWQAGVQGDGPMAAGVRDQRPGVQGTGQETGTVLTQSVAGAPAASSYHDHGGQAVVEHMGAAAAASPSLAGQLGPRAPSGVPVLGPERTAPTGTGAEFRVNTPQAAAPGGAVYLPGTIGGSY